MPIADWKGHSASKPLQSSLELYMVYVMYITIVAMFIESSELVPSSQSKS